MADNKYKSQAEKAAQNAAKNSKPKASAPASKKMVNDMKKAQANDKKQADAKATANAEEKQIPPRLISSLVFLGMFILFLIIFFNDEGAITHLIANLVRGLFGDIGFIISIPAGTSVTSLGTNLSF